MKRITRRTLRKIAQGDAITEEELESGLHFFYAMADGSRAMGEIMTKVEVGQKLFLVCWDRYAKPPGYQKSWATVEKVGRKWATLEGHFRDRVDIETLTFDSNYPERRRIFLSEEDFNTQIRKEEAWSLLRKHFSNAYSFSKDMTVERLETAIEALGITPESVA